jgi:hypothetical protein
VPAAEKVVFWATVLEETVMSTDAVPDVREVASEPPGVKVPGR